MAARAAPPRVRASHTPYELFGMQRSAFSEQAVLLCVTPTAPSSGCSLHPMKRGAAATADGCWHAEDVVDQSQIIAAPRRARRVPPR